VDDIHTALIEKEEDMNTTKLEDENHLQPFVALDQKQLVFVLTCPA
jgi:hypothetical protein